MRSEREQTRLGPSAGFGDAFALVAVPLLVLEATHSVADMGLVSAAGVAAQVVTSLVSGNVVDRLDRCRLIGCTPPMPSSRARWHWPTWPAP